MRSDMPGFRNTHGRDARVTATVLVASVSLALAGCGSFGRSRVDDNAAPSAAGETRGRTQMWAENCNRCHNARPASWYSRREWAVAMHHMQVRGYLTGDETRGITEFFHATK